MKQTKLLDEAGLVITPTYIAGPAHRFTFREIKTIRLAHAPNIFGLFKKHPYQFIVNNFKTEVVVFETFDKALVSRIQAALSAARDTHARDGGIISNTAPPALTPANTSISPTISWPSASSKKSTSTTPPSMQPQP